MSTEKLHLQNILVPDIGQEFAVKHVSSVRFRGDDAPNKVRAIPPRPWHAKDHFATHRLTLAEESGMGEDFAFCRWSIGIAE
jgi:hypothetical protein